MFVDFAKLLWPGAALVAANSDAYDIAALEPYRLVHYAACLIHSEVADRVEDPIERHAEVAFAALATALGSFEERRKLLSAPLHDAGRDVDFGVNHILRVQLLHHAIGDQLVVVGGAQALGNRLECHQKASEVLVSIQRAGFFLA